MLPVSRSASSTPSLGFFSNGLAEAQNATWYNLCETKHPIYAIANSGFVNDRIRQRHFLLVPAAAFSSGGRRFSLGHRGRATPSCRAKSLFRIVETVSTPGGFVRIAVCEAVSGDCRRNVLRHRLRPAGIRTHPTRLPPAPDFSGLPLLGRNPDGTMGSAYHGERLLSPLA